MKLQFDSQGFSKIPLLPQDVGLFLYQEFTHKGKRQGLYKKFIMWITARTNCTYNTKPVSCSLVIKKHKPRKGASDKKTMQFYLSFKYFSYSYADWKEIKLGLRGVHALWLRRNAKNELPF